LQPVVQCGKDGVTDAFIAAANAAIDKHELIKVRLGENAEGDRQDLATTIAEATRAELVGVTGRTVLLYRRNPKKSVIQLPKKGAAKPPSAAAPVVQDDGGDDDDLGSDDDATDDEAADDDPADSDAGDDATGADDDG
jgi:RNA-binding protein